MSEKSPSAAARSLSDRQRLDTPRGTRRFRVTYDVEPSAGPSENFARFLGTGRYLMIQTVIVIVWIIINVFAVRLQWDPYPFILLNLAFSTQPPTRRRSSCWHRTARRTATASPSRRTAPARADESGHRIPRPGTGRAAHRDRRGGHPRLPAARTRRDQDAAGRRGRHAHPAEVTPANPPKLRHGQSRICNVSHIFSDVCGVHRRRAPQGVIECGYVDC